MTEQVIPRDRLGALTRIAQGGQGVVYGAPNVKTKFAASMVYKEYKPQTSADIDFTALAAMPALVQDALSYAQAEQLISIAAWPCALVEDGSTSTGFVMPAIPAEFFIPLTTVTGVSTTTAEFQHLLNHSSVLAARGIELDDVQRYTLLREVASALAFLHKHDVCVGDISPKNLLFSLTPREAVFFIDCDAMRINGVSVLPQVETPGWEVPAGEERATIYSDAFKLGLLSLRLLAGDHDTRNPDLLPSTTPNLLRQIIADTLKPQPASRPLPEAWIHVLGDAIEHAQHQQKTAAAETAPADRGGPAVPVVHSRPPIPTSQPKPAAAVSAPPPLTAEPRSVAAPFPPPTPPARGRSNRTVIGLLIGVIVVLAVALGLAIGIPALKKHQSAAPPSQRSYREPVVLPFDGLKGPRSVEVDGTGNVYVTDSGNKRVLKLAAGSTTQTVLPFTGLDSPEGVTVDSAGTVYVADFAADKIVELAPGSSNPTVRSLPSSQINGIAVDSAGNIYGADANNQRVVKLAPDASDPTVLPFTGLGYVSGVAVDNAGNIYVTDDTSGKVWKLAAGSSTPTVLPFTLKRAIDIAVDGAGNVYVNDATHVLMLGPGSSTPTVLPLGRLKPPLQPWSVAVENSGSLYIADYFTSRVVKIPFE